ncbi:MAG: hypothetical protein ABI426_07085 [Flavobacterium sp.]
MKKLIILMFVVVATIGCSKEDVPTATPETPDPNAMKIFNTTTGAEIKDGDVIVFTSLVEPGNKLSFYVKNAGSTDMNVRSRLVSILNGDGSNMQYCFGINCFNSVGEGLTYPTNNHELVTVPANSSLGSGAFKMENFAAPTNGATVADYVFEFYQHDAQMNEVGNKVRFTYRYQQ